MADQNDTNYRTRDTDTAVIDDTNYQKDAEKVARDDNSGYDATIGGGIGLVGGAVIGGIAGGPVGAIIGAVVGGIASDVAVGAIDRHDHDGSPGDTGAGSSTGWTDPSGDSRPFQDTADMSGSDNDGKTVVIAPIGTGYGTGTMGATGQYGAIVDTTMGRTPLFGELDRRDDYDDEAEVDRDVADSERVTERLDRPADQSIR